MSNVIFFPVKHFPSYTTLKKLEQIQMELNKFHSDIKIDCKDPYELAVRKQQLANRIKNRIHIVKDCVNND